VAAAPASSGFKFGTAPSFGDAPAAAVGGFSFAPAEAGTPVGKSISDFKFGSSSLASTPAAAAGAFGFGATSPPAASSARATPSREAASSAASKASSSAAAAAADDEDGEPSECDARAGAAFDEIDAEGSGIVSMDQFESLLDSLGEGFYGDEMERQCRAVDPEESGSLRRAAFLAFYAKLVAGGNGAEDDEADEEDVEEERENARVAFDSIDTAGRGLVPSSTLKALMEALGTVYCEEEHRRTAKRLANAEGMFERRAFVEWYARWVTDDGGDEDDDDDEDAGEEASDAGEADPADEGALSAKWQQLSGVQEGRWKCGVCSVQNVKEAAKCAACETANPAGAPAGAATSASKRPAPQAAGSIGSGGFSFGSSGGSSFGAAPAGAPASSTTVFGFEKI